MVLASDAAGFGDRTGLTTGWHGSCAMEPAGHRLTRDRMAEKGHYLKDSVTDIKVPINLLIYLPYILIATLPSSQFLPPQLLILFFFPLRSFIFQYVTQGSFKLTASVSQVQEGNNKPSVHWC